MTDTVQRPAQELADPKQLLLAYLDFYRSVIARKLDGLAESELRSSRLPSGWTPLELRWGFVAEQLAAPWGDEDESGRWHVHPQETAADLLAALDAGGTRTRAIVAGAELTDIAAAGGRFADGDRRPTLAWILFHVLQEYARHAGHLDASRELLDGAVGE